MIVQGTKLAIAFLSASLAYACMIVILPYTTNTASASFATMGMCILFAAMFYMGLRKLLIKRMTYAAFALSILLGVAIFYITAL